MVDSSFPLYLYTIHVLFLAELPSLLPDFIIKLFCILKRPHLKIDGFALYHKLTADKVRISASIVGIQL